MAQQFAAIGLAAFGTAIAYEPARNGFYHNERLLYGLSSNPSHFDRMSMLILQFALSSKTFFYPLCP